MKKTHLLLSLPLALGAMSVGSGVAHAVPIAYGGGTTTVETFDSLSNNETVINSQIAPSNFEFAQGLASGSSVNYTLGPTSNPAGTADYRASNGSNTSNTGGTADLYSFGSTGSTDRAFGSIAGNSQATSANPIPANYYGFGFTNASGSAITTLTVNYTGEQWRNGSTASQKLMFQYRVGGAATDNILTSTPSYTNFTSLDFTSKINTGTGTGLDGNLAANRTVFSGIDITGLNIADGETFFFRWADINDSGNDHGLGIDDFSFSSNVMATPEPETWAMMALGLGALAMFTWKRKKSEGDVAYGSGFAI